MSRAHILAYTGFLVLFAHPRVCFGCFSGHYTGHFRAVITKPQNVFVLKDIMSNGYRAGGNTKFFGTDLEAIKVALMKRLNMDDNDPDEDQPSLLAFPMSAQQFESGAMDTVMSVTSRLLPYEVAAGSQYKSFPGGKEMFDLYNGKIGLRAVHFGEDLRASENMEYMSQVYPLISTQQCTHTHLPPTFLCLFRCAQGSTNNSLCFLGPHRRYNGKDDIYSQLIPGMGHWGPDARPGDVCASPGRFSLASLCLRIRSCVNLAPRASPRLQARWRRGESVSMIASREAMMTYEQLAYIPKPKA